MEITILIPIIIATTEMIKRIGISERYAPLVSVALGIGYYLTMNGFTVDNGFQGLVAGLMASGLYSGTKAVIGK